MQSIQRRSLHTYKLLNLLIFELNLRKGLFSETNTTKNVDVYRRNLQRAYVDRMSFLMTEDLEGSRRGSYFNVSQSDIRALVRGELNSLKRQVNTASNRPVNTITKYHYRDLSKRIENIIDPK